MLKVKPVETKSDLNTFIDFGLDHYRGDPYFAPMPRLAQVDLFNEKKNPFFKHATLQSFLAFSEEGGRSRCVGRITATIDRNHEKTHGEKCGYFGFFECIDDVRVSDALFKTAMEWLKSRGMELVRGPLNPSMNHEVGLLVEGFDDIPTLMTTYNKPYYAKLIEQAGFHKAKDMYAYLLTDDTPFDESLVKQVERLKAKARIKVRHVNMKEYDQEVERFLEIYNDAWEKNWGFVPIEPEEFRYMAKDMKLFLDPRWMMVAERDGEPIGFSLTFPDVNQVLHKLPTGRLLPFGWLKLLWNLKGPGRKKTINRIRIMGLGVKKDYVRLGVGPMMYLEHRIQGLQDGYKKGEASWILEDNQLMIKALERMNAKRSKTYRLYDRSLTQ